ncbi:MAG TPA: hypothetical protein VFC31_13055 [Candidatus Limnocylindria bacterium]|nr:hypothetical protein [Candidatus Limnocylindria bacterium]
MIADSPTAVVYARIASGLKIQVEAYASERGMTLTAAVVDLLERGLEAVSNAASLDQLRERIAEQDREFSTARVELAEANAALSSLQERERSLQTLAQRAGQILGPCPHCSKPVSGVDVLVTGHCPSCGRGLTSVLVGPQMKGLDQTELLLLLGALGIVLGAAYLGSKSGR